LLINFFPVPTFHRVLLIIISWLFTLISLFPFEMNNKIYHLYFRIFRYLTTSNQYFNQSNSVVKKKVKN
jgi:hypothetical protein